MKIDINPKDNILEVKERIVYELWMGDTFITADIDERKIHGIKKVIMNTLNKYINKQ